MFRVIETDRTSDDIGVVDVMLDRVLYVFSS